MSRLSVTRSQIYNTIARQLNGVVPCRVGGKVVTSRMGLDCVTAKLLRAPWPPHG